MEEKDSVTIQVHDKSGKVIRRLQVPVEELVVCWMNVHFPSPNQYKIMS